jgi:D-alanyl-D-alanine carboxypeptidase
MNIPRKLIALLLCALALLPARAIPVSSRDEYHHTAEEHLPTTPLDIATSAGSAVILDASGPHIRTLWAQNADKRRGPASTTKIMTALVAAESMPLSAKVSIPKEAVGIEGSSVYLTEGEVFTLEELLCCTLLESANDAATAVAIAVSGSIEDFAVLMNEKCAELGLVDTHFTNPHGLDDDEHYTTARGSAIQYGGAS